MDRRPLNQFERMVVDADTAQPFNAVVALHLSPSLPADIVRTALTEVQRRHPALRARVSDAGGGSFIYSVRHPPEFSEKVLAGPGDWDAEVEACLNLRIDRTTGPLFRCVSLRSEDGARGVLVLAFHHTIVDASSLEALLQELLGSISGKDLREEPAPPMPLIEPRFPRSYRGLRKALSLAGFMVRQVFREFTFQLRSAGRPQLPVQPAARSKTFCLALNRTETENLVRAARRHGITLNSALNAALAIAVCRTLYTGENRPVRMLTFADLRPYLDPPLGPEALGCAISMLRIDVPYKQGDTLWDLARQAHPAFTAAFRKGEKFAAHLLADRVVRLVIRIGRVRLGTSALSYTGPLALPETIGDYHLDGVNAWISNNRFGPILSAQARLFREKLWFDGLYLDTDMSEEKAQRLVRDVRALLVES